MRRTLLVVVACLVILLPLGIAVSRNWDKISQAIEKQKYISRSPVSPQYSAAAKVPGYSIAVVDTRFLEYIAATLNLYDDIAIIDPEVYFGNQLTAKRHTVSHLRLELAPILDTYVVGLGGSIDFAARGVYAVEGDTLVVRISLDEEQVKKSEAPGQYMMEDLFLDATLQTLSYAVSKPGQPMNPAELSKLQQSIKDNVLSGLFQRPIRIEKVRP